MNIYFSGIGGVGIGPLAEIAIEAGYNVFGSDIAESLMTKELVSSRARINIGEQNGIFLQKMFDKFGIDWLVYTSSLPESHPELVLAKKLGIKISKRDELLNKIIQEKNMRLLAVAGTHGKTTTTGMLIWTMQQLKIPISWSVGTTFSFGKSGFFDYDSSFFLYEADEFDRNFLNFSPFVSLITSIDYDHTDIYKTQTEYLEAFKDFGDKSNFIFSWKDQHGEIFENLPNSVILSQPDSELTLFGDHNKRNAMLVLACLEYLCEAQGFDFGDSWQKRAVQALNNFPGVDRRFEEISKGIFSDYGHHPIEIKSTLQMAQEVAKKTGYSGVSLIYQPHQNVRQTEIQDEYISNIFEKADEIIWLPTFLSREDPEFEILSPEFLSRKLAKNNLLFFEMNEKLSFEIDKLKSENRLILAMSAGNLDDWIRKNEIR